MEASAEGPTDVESSRLKVPAPAAQGIAPATLAAIVADASIAAPIDPRCTHDRMRRAGIDRGNRPGHFAAEAFASGR